MRLHVKDGLSANQALVCTHLSDSRESLILERSSKSAQQGRDAKMQRAGLATLDPLQGSGFSSANSAQVDELEGA